MSAVVEAVGLRKSYRRGPEEVATFEMPAGARGRRDSEHARVDDHEALVTEVLGEPLGRDERRGQIEGGHAHTQAARRGAGSGCRNRP